MLLFRMGATASAVLYCASTAIAGGAYAEQEQTIYPYKTSQNYCQEGLQPVVVSGAISCGVPTAEISYQAAKATPGHRQKRHRSHASSDCTVGLKGCR